MLLQEVFDYLTYGELSQFFAGGLEDGGVQSSSYPKIIHNINMGLTELYKDLPLSTREVYLQLYDHIATYTLHSDYAESNTGSVQPYKYILDSVYEPFIDNILILDSVFNEAGEEYPINESGQTYSVFTPSYNTIQVPFADSANTLSLVYRAAPTKVQIIGVNPATADVPIPPQLLPALISYVAHKLHAASNSVEEANLAGMFYNKYKQQVAEVKLLGLIQTETAINNKFWSNGWR